MNSMLSLCCWVFLWLMTAETLAQGPSLRIGFTNSLGVTNYSQATMDRIGQFRWFFAHASVGNLMMEGIVTLHQSNPGFYQFQQVSEDRSPPPTTQPGSIYDYMRFNSDWWTKVDGFQTYLSNGWGFLLSFLGTPQAAYYVVAQTNAAAPMPRWAVLAGSTNLVTNTQGRW